MEKKNFKFAILSGNTLKLLAAVFMVIDHAGLMLFNYFMPMRIIGRLAYPIFAFMIAEGCKYTKNKLNYFGNIFILGVIFQIVYYVAEKSLMMSIFITFSLSILMIYALQYFKKQLFAKNWIMSAIAFTIFALSIACTYALNQVLDIDYGFWGSMMPVIVSLFHADPKDENQKFLQKIDCIPLSVFMAAVAIVIIAINLHYTAFSLQEYAILSIPLLLMYSGERGKYKMKYFFYVFYPLHLVVLYGITLLLNISFSL